MKVTSALLAHIVFAVVTLAADDSNSWPSGVTNCYHSDRCQAAQTSWLDCHAQANSSEPSSSALVTGCLCGSDVPQQVPRDFTGSLEICLQCFANISTSYAAVSDQVNNATHSLCLSTNSTIISLEYWTGEVQSIGEDADFPLVLPNITLVPGGPQAACDAVSTLTISAGTITVYVGASSGATSVTSTQTAAGVVTSSLHGYGSVSSSISQSKTASGNNTSSNPVNSLDRSSKGLSNSTSISNSKTADDEITMPTTSSHVSTTLSKGSSNSNSTALGIVSSALPKNETSSGAKADAQTPHVPVVKNLTQAGCLQTYDCQISGDIYESCFNPSEFSDPWPCMCETYHDTYFAYSAACISCLSTSLGNPHTSDKTANPNDTFISDARALPIDYCKKNFTGQGNVTTPVWTKYGPLFSEIYHTNVLFYNLTWSETTFSLNETMTNGVDKRASDPDASGDLQQVKSLPDVLHPLHDLGESMPAGVDPVDSAREK